MEEIKNLDIKYRNQIGDNNNIAEQFLKPCLKHFSKWRRCTLGFSSSALKTWAGNLRNIVEHKDKTIEIICDINKANDDYHLMQALEHCSTKEKKIETLLKYQEDIILTAFGADKAGGDSPEFKKKYGWKLLHYLIANEQLVIKFAINLISERSNLYHEKAGYFEFPDGSKVAHEGSFNESDSGHRWNIESVSVFSSFRESDAERVQRTIDDVNEDWSGSPSVEIRTLSKKTLDYIKSNAPKKAPQRESKRSEGNQQDLFEKKSNPFNVPIIPKELEGNPFKMKKHQTNAFKEWVRKGGKGILWHATGSGKTITSLYTLSKLAEGPGGIKGQKIIAIMQIPTTPLADQWVDELENFNLQAIRCYGSRDKWFNELTNEINFFKQREGPYILPIVVLDKTYSLEPFQECLNQMLAQFKQNIFYICDECHRFANKGKTKKLPDVSWKMGLSGSPFYSENQDSIGDIELINYFGEVIDKYEIKEALAEGVLTPYDYHPIKTYLNEDEYDEIKEIEKKIAQAGTNEDDQLNQAGLIKAGERNRVISTIKDKFRVFEKFINKDEITKNRSKTLFFVGDGSTELDYDDANTPDSSLRMLDKVKKITNKAGYHSAQFTCDENIKERRKIISDFSQDVLDAVIAIRVLDEGIDIPGITTAFILASTANRRQFVQRRGRILRKAPGKKKSVIYDFIVLPPKNKNCSYLRREIVRIIEMGDDCTNKNDAKEMVKYILDNYVIDHPETLAIASSFTES